MANSIKIKTSLEGSKVRVRALINHPMDTGRNEDADGRLIEARYIEQIRFLIDDQPVFSANWTTSVSANPYLAFRCPGRKGQQLLIHWRDNTGEEDSKTHTL